MSSLDIAERRLPQDGRMRIRVGGKDYDLRVSIMPTVHGEKIVLRLLDKSNLSASIDKLGLDADTFNQFKNAVDEPHGFDAAARIGQRDSKARREMGRLRSGARGHRPRREKAMMLDVAALVDRLLPGLLHGDVRSVACICTTRPKYLVFDDDAARPRCVVEFGERDRLVRTDRVLKELGSRINGTVPGSLFCGAVHDGTNVHIQAGLPGVPWFRVSDSLDTREAWRALLRRAMTAMLRLHGAARQVPAWNGTVNIAYELRRQTALCGRNGTQLSATVLRRIDEMASAKQAAAPLAAVWQHGDFSLNNLLVDAESVSIIDFEEFGATQVPLHDAFGLALSVPLSQGSRCPLSIRDCITDCLRPALRDEGIAPAQTSLLFMHHLLWRINQCHGLGRRAPLRVTLLDWVDQFVDAPGSFISRQLR